MGAPNHCAENAMEVYGGPFASTAFRTFCGLTSTHIYTGESLLYIRLFLMDEAHLLASNFRILFSSYTRRAINCSDQNLFDCGDEICIPRSLICNGRSNCLYRRDEFDCDSGNTLPNIVNSLYRSGHMPILIILIVLITVVTGLCLYYRPSKKTAMSHSNNSERMLRIEQLHNAKTNAVEKCSTVATTGRPPKCSNLNSKTMPNLAQSKSANSFSNWSLSDLTVENHYENCASNSMGKVPLTLHYAQKKAENFDCQYRGTLLGQTQQQQLDDDGQPKQKELSENKLGATKIVTV
uniref:CUB domain-containing protein n=1 Tax=Globodera rostochiensis TaxID=31243 RepID=A0A914HV87_GLORO